MRLPLFIYQAETKGKPFCISGGAATYNGYGVALYLDENEVIQGLNVHKGTGHPNTVKFIQGFGTIPEPGMQNVNVMSSDDMYALEVYLASKHEPAQRLTARLRDAIETGDKTAIEVYLRILGGK